MKPTLLVLAAGIGSRYGSLKQVDKIGPSGETIIDYSIYDAIKAGFGKIVFVIRKSIETEFKEVFNEIGQRIKIEYIYQELDNVPSGIKIPAERQKPWGTGHAVLVSANKIDTPFAVINADDFYGAESFHIMSKHLSLKHDSDIDTYCMIGYVLANTLSEHGYVARGICEISNDNTLKGIVERTQIQKINEKIVYVDTENKKITLNGSDIVSMNFWGFPLSVFDHLKSKFYAFISSNYQNPKSEFFIPLAVNELIKEGKARVHVLNSHDPWFGVTYKKDKEATIKKLRNLISKGIYPEKLWQ